MLSTPVELLPANEPARLHALHQTDILQSLQEGVFDELVALTAGVFNLPIAYISLVGAHESEYKATYGFAPLPPQPRASMLCSVAVRESQVVVYHDLAAATPTPADALAIERALAHRARFHAAAPLRIADEFSIGTLCLVDQEPRAFSEAEQRVLDYVAGIVSSVITVRQRYRAQPGPPDASWAEVHTLLHDEVQALGALVRYLATRYGVQVPVPADVLQPVMRRLADLRNILEAHQYA